MTSKTFDPRRLDVLAFAAAGARLQGAEPMLQLARLAATQDAAADAGGKVSWSVQGSKREREGLEAEHWLHIQADATVQPTCQRCLQPLPIALRVDVRVRFVRDERQAEELDAQSDDYDVLAATGREDLLDLIEDELLLQLPFAPLHDVCPQSLRQPSAAALPPSDAAQAPHPFAALKGWKPG
ncbi:MAG: YceD family protein [Aquabacterium sp.]